MNGSIDTFRQVIEQAGLVPGEIVPDGALHRCPVTAKPQGKDGAYIFHPDPPVSGWFQNWRGESPPQTWTAENQEDMTPEERKALKVRIQADKEARAKAQAERYTEARDKAAQIAASCVPATAEYPYLQRKGVNACAGLLQSQDGKLVVPVLGPDGKPQSLQFIDQDGSKLFLSGGKVGGGYFPIKGKDGSLYVAEGLATGLSVHEATEQTVLTAFNAGNLRAVAEYARKLYPDREIIIAADNDTETDGNPGLTKAKHAAEAVGGKVAVPVHPEDSGKKVDFNDLHAVAGIDMVREQLGQVQEIERETRGKSTPPAQTTPSVPIMTPDMLPRNLVAWAEDIAERMQAPLEFVAISVIVALSALWGRKTAIRPKAKDDWTVTANLWGGLVARPSRKKSPTMEEAVRPLKRLQSEALTAHTDWLDEHQGRKVVLESAIEIGKKNLRAALKDGDGPEVLARFEREVTEAQKELEELTSKEAPRILVNDASVPKLIELFRANPNGVFLLRDELSGFLRSLTKNGNEGDREFYLEAWSGDGSFTQDRIGRGSVHASGLCLSVLGGIQPGKLDAYIKGATSGGIEDDGLLQRFQLLVWPDDTPDYQHIDRYPDSQARDLAYEVFKHFSTKDAEDIDAAHDKFTDVRFVRFDSSAQAVFDEWLIALEKRLRSGELKHAPGFEAHLGKFRSLIPSLALLFHLADDGKGSVTLPHLRLAIRWGDFLEAHARKVYASELGRIAVPTLKERVAVAIVELADKIEGGKLPTRLIVEHLNKGLPPEQFVAAMSVGKTYAHLGLCGVGTRRERCVAVSVEQLERLKALIPETTVTSVTSVTDQDRATVSTGDTSKCQPSHPSQAQGRRGQKVTLVTLAKSTVTDGDLHEPRGGDACDTCDASFQEMPPEIPLPTDEDFVGEEYMEDYRV